MAFDGQDVIDEIEYLGNDDANNTEFPTTEAPRFMTEALNIIISKRPDVLLQTDGTLDTPADITDLTTAVELPDKWKAVMVEWFLYRGCQSDSRDVQDLRQASAHKKLFFELLGGV